MNVPNDIAIEPPKRLRSPKQTTKSEILSAGMSKSCARDLTDRIKDGVNDVAEMLHRAHEGRAWVALSYCSWKEYCQTEFQMSERHSYRLLEFVEIRNIIQDTDPGVSPVSEKQVRPLTTLSPELQPVAWVRASEIAGGKQPTSRQVEEAAFEVVSNGDDEAERQRRLDRQHKMRCTRARGESLIRAWQKATDDQRKQLLRIALVKSDSLRTWIRIELKMIDEERAASARTLEPPL